MNVIRFPKLFENNVTSIITDDANATLQSMHLLVGSEAETLFGDPEFGLKIRRFAFDQNNYILKDILIDEIYSKIITFMPNIFIERKNITLDQVDHVIYAKITCKNRDNFQTNTYNLALLQDEEIG